MCQCKSTAFEGNSLFFFVQSDKSGFIVASITGRVLWRSQAQVLCGHGCQKLRRQTVECSLDENEWVRLCGHSIWISSISSLIYSTSSPSKRPALHIGGVLWLRRFGKLTLLSDLWLGGSTVALSLSPFLLLLPKKIPLKSAGWEGFPLVWRQIFNLSLLVFHSSPSTNPSQSRRPLRSWHSPFPAALLYLSFLVLPSHLTPLCDGLSALLFSTSTPLVSLCCVLTAVHLHRNHKMNLCLLETWWCSLIDLIIN